MSRWTERFLRALHEFHRMNSRFNQRGGPPLPPGEFFFLERLCDGPQRGGMNLSCLRDRDRMSPPAMSQMLGSLERKGLIERSMSKEDRRHTVVAVTPQGRAVVDEARRMLNVQMEQVIDRFGEDQAERLTELLESLNQVIADMVRDGKNEVKEP